MGLLAPWYLLLTGAAAVPLLLHLLRRRIGTRVDFPAVRYLLRAEQEQSARLRLKNWLLMALRVLAVLCIALAAARPVARGGTAGHVPTGLAIVLDNSLSTTAVVGGRPVLDGLRDAARRVAAATTPDDRVWLVLADGRVLGADRQAVLAAIASAEPLGGAGDLPAAVARAAEVARSATRSATAVAIVTDGQATAWQAAIDGRGVAMTFYVADGQPPRNHAVVAAVPRPARWTPNGSVVARILSPDSAAFRVTEAGAGGAGRTLARGTAAPDAEVAVPVQPGARGWVVGRVAVEPDELRGDDERAFAAYSAPPPAAVADPSAGPFAASALATLAQSGRVTTATNDAVRLVAADAATRLPALVIAPSDAARIGPANLALERLGIPWRFAAARTGASPVRFAGPPDSTRDGILVSQRFVLAPRAAARTDTLATAGGEPWIVAGPGYVLVASPLAPEATGFPVRAAFVPWLGEVLAQRLGGAATSVGEAAPHARIDAPADADALELADGRRVLVTPGAMPAPDRQGVYFWLRGGTRIGALVVNAEPEESQLARVNGRTLIGQVHGGTARLAATPDELARAAFGTEGRRPVGGPILAAGLLALLAEGVATRRRRAAGAAH